MCKWVTAAPGGTQNRVLGYLLVVQGLLTLKGREEHCKPCSLRGVSDLPKSHSDR